MIRHALFPFLLVAAPAAAQDIAPADYVAARQAQMAAMQALAYHVELEAEGADDLTVFRLAEEAGAIAALLRAVPMLFPEGTAPDDLPEDVVSMASPAIWEDPDGFSAAAATALEAAEALAAAPDAAALLEGVQAMNAACTGCHEAYLNYDPLAQIPAPAEGVDEGLFDFSE